MKKNFFLLVMIAVTIMFYSCNNNERNDLKNLNLYGKIKYIEEKVYFAKDKFGQLEKDNLKEYSLSIFNKDGNFTSFINKSDKIINKYNSKGKLTEQSYYNLEGNLYFKNVYLYNSLGHIIETNVYDSEGKIMRKGAYTSDEEGNIVEGITFDERIEIMKKDIYKYDKKGNMIENIYYDSDGGLSGKEIYKYDKKGNMIEHMYYDSDGSLRGKKIFICDSKGNNTEIKYYDNSGSLLTQIGNEYTYDKKDNWIKKITKDSDNNFYITERKIVYYGDDDEDNYPEWNSPSYRGVLIQSTETPTETPVEEYALEVPAETPTDDLSDY